MFRTIVTVHPQGLIYYTSYTLMVLIKIYKLGRQNVVDCVEFWTLYRLLHARHLFASDGIICR
jgi:hypothetical protein